MSEALAEHPAPPADHSDPESDSGAHPGSSHTEQPSSGAGVKGRIKVADEVIEKIASLAALEVEGVADMGGDLARAFESVRDRIGIGSRRGNQGVSAQIHDRQVTVNLTIVIEYGHIVMEVAAEVKTNVARTVSHMLGMRVTEVNVTVDD
ncbi:Asp23/Gls24 family envelope stress response protein, partial [Nonomuraea sp. K274]